MTRQKRKRNFNHVCGNTLIVSTNFRNVHENTMIIQTNIKINGPRDLRSFYKAVEQKYQCLLEFKHVLEG